MSQKYLPYDKRDLCSCGCGEKTSGRWDSKSKRYVKFLPFHHIRTKDYLDKLTIRTKNLMTGRKQSEEHKLKRAKSTSLGLRKSYASGKIKPWNKGILRTEEYKKQNSERSKILWKNEEYKKNWEEGMKNKVIILPSSLERRFIEIIKENSLPFKYVGDGYTFIGGKCPDFIDFKNKKIIEVNGEYWHKGENVQNRIDHFLKYGYNTLIISSINGRKFDDEKEVIDKVISFSQSTIP